MKILVTKHAISRYQERIRPCSQSAAKAGLLAIYMHGRLTHTLPAGDRFFQTGSQRIVVDPLGRIVTTYLT